MVHFYPFRRYAKDLILWTCGCDIPLHAQGPAAVMQLGGTARALADEISLDQLTIGITADWGDGAGLIHRPGTHVLIRRLGERFNELEIETVLRTLVDFMTFHRLGKEDIDTALTRFDILYSRARESAHFEVSPSVLAFLMLSMLGIQYHRWTMLFMNWGGQFPTTDVHVHSLKSNIRQQAHILEQPGSYLGPDRGAAYMFDIYRHDTGTDPNANDLNIYYGDNQDNTGTNPFGFANHGQYYPTGTSPTETCTHCGTTDPNYFGDFDTDTESEDDETFFGDTDTAETLHENYLFHKKKWRKFTGRRTRQTRYGMRNQRKGKGKGKDPGHFCVCCNAYDDAFMTEEIYYGGKKGGKGGFRGGKSNGQSSSNLGSPSLDTYGSPQSPQAVDVSVQATLQTQDTYGSPQVPC